MTIETFNNTKFSGKETVVWNGNEYPIVAVDFEEHLIGILELENQGDDDVYWKRCENIEIKTSHLQ